jgi:acyl-CoA thioesterase I
MTVNQNEIRLVSYGALRTKRHTRRLLNPFFLFLCLMMGAFGTKAMAQQSPEPRNQPLKIVALGDSLTAGYGLAQQAALPMVLERSLRVKYPQLEMINAGVSGDTASGGRERMNWSIPDDAKGVIVALGANDMLRGVDPAITRKALEDIIINLQERGMKVMLVGMKSAPNLGADFAARFDAIYPELAKRYNLTFYPFLLEGVAGQRSLNLPDGIHPTVEGVTIIAARMLPSVENFVTTLQ